MQELAERAGFIDATVEPAPVALERVLSPRVAVARRDASSGQSWAAIYEHGTPGAATTVDTSHRE